MAISNRTIKRKVTMTDVARQAGVSQTTVSIVVNNDDTPNIPDETRQRILDAIEELGYEPDALAQALRSGSTRTIALIIPDLRNPHFCEYATGIEEAARSAGYHLLLSSTTMNDEYAVEIFKDLSRRRFDGLIIATSFILESQEAQDTLEQVRKRGLPIVEMDENYGVDSVFADYHEATKEVMSYLLSLGHRRIGMIYGIGAHELGEDRLQPYQEGLKAAGIPIDPSLIARCGPAIEDGYQAALKLLQLPSRPTAIISINDLLAISALRAAADLGLRVPADLSLVGFDDIPMANYLAPRLTTVTKDARAAGTRAFEVLLARIKNHDLPRQLVRLQTRLILRESTGLAPRVVKPGVVK
jgi:LacI family transcriptional regulator